MNSDFKEVNLEELNFEILEIAFSRTLLLIICPTRPFLVLKIRTLYFFECTFLARYFSMKQGIVTLTGPYREY